MTKSKRINITITEIIIDNFYLGNTYLIFDFQ